MWITFFGLYQKYSYICITIKKLDMKPSEKVRILVFPVKTYDRRRDVEFIECNGYTIEEIEAKFGSDVQVLTLTDFADLCNNQELNLESCWITYVNFIDELDDIYLRLGVYTANDESEYPVMIEALKKALVETPEQMVDYVDGVTMWELAEYNYTVKQFCELIGLTK